MMEHSNSAEEVGFDPMKRISDPTTIHNVAFSSFKEIGGQIPTKIITDTLLSVPAGHSRQYSDAGQWAAVYNAAFQN